MRTLPARVRAGAVVVRRVLEPELAKTESVYGRWSRHCLEHMPDLEELRQAFAPYSPTRSILILPHNTAPSLVQAAFEHTEPAKPSSHDRVAEILGISSECLYTASSLRLASPAARQGALSGYLRACWQCMKLGFHSVLFQHYALRRCPLHGVELTTRCPSCQVQSWPKFAEVAASPFSCKRCGEMWLSSVRPAHGDEYLVLVGAMLEDRIRDLSQVDVPGKGERFVNQADATPLIAPPGPNAAARHGRHVARWTAWPEVPSARWATFPETRQTLIDWHEPREGCWPDGGPLTVQAATACLRTLARLCCVEGHTADSLKLRERLGLPSNGLRMNDRASIVSAALHQTMCAYAIRARLGQADSLNARALDSVYADVEWNGLQRGHRLVHSDAGNAQLIRAEILGWFVACVIDASTLQYLRNVDWITDLPKTLFLPAWIVMGTHPHYFLRMRERVPERTVRRLLRRYPPDLLLYERTAWDESPVRRGFSTNWRQTLRTTMGDPVVAAPPIGVPGMPEEDVTVGPWQGLWRRNTGLPNV